ncbi:hypothetical protein COMA2_130018 [Candidatus Nitrospira nitrificans]|uniref:Uncharacterized protein n=1 Tax=Candidatus Nitrospira nitrificans TaxID=1742973 RepID=A0A0S4L6L0_9BACT|nr:hypothetical protein COMA2_130018 [Candidatus Nitrospira nitrificans]
MSRCSLWSRLGFNHGNQASDRIPALEQSRDLLNFFGAQHAVNDRRDEMQGLTAQKIHRPHGFQKHRRRSRHASFDNHLGYSFKQLDIFNGEGLSLRSNGKRMAQAGSQVSQFFDDVFLGECRHK